MTYEKITANKAEKNRIKDFYKCDLSGQDLSGIDFTGTSFRNAKLTDCSFVGCDLTGCDFEGAILFDSDFKNACFTNCNFLGCIGLTVFTFSGHWPCDMFQYIVEMDIVITENLWASRQDYFDTRRQAKTQPEGYPEYLWKMVFGLSDEYKKEVGSRRIFREDRPLPIKYCNYFPDYPEHRANRHTDLP